ncbi:hypothetical protein GALL_280700 [mine drainage metagenome]|uniref:SHOCT domain-containing protein n=1 Tax=mine drainage metagenome TaxID=410659 RepID=A0A1J5RDC6_9ZZZZ
MMGFDYGGMGLARLFMQDRSEPRQRTAVEILDARYARGEIDRDEYVKRRDDLTGGA